LEADRERRLAEALGIECIGWRVDVSVDHIGRAAIAWHDAVVELAGCKQQQEHAAHWIHCSAGYAATDVAEDTGRLRFPTANSAGTTISAVSTVVISPISDAVPKPRIARFALTSSEP
jgi:hypothetical protein